MHRVGGHSLTGNGQGPLSFYSRGLESQLECPSAEILLEKLWACGWNGHCFILKGHYREFSDSFAKHIYRSQDTQGLEDAGGAQPTAITSQTDTSANQQEFANLLSRLEREDQLRYLGTSPGQNEERTSALEEHEKELENEFQDRFPALYKKAQDVHGPVAGRSDDDNFVTKAQMVEYLDRGLTKIRDAQAAGPPATTYEPGHSKLAAEGYFDRAYLDRESDEYVEVGRSDEQAGGEGSPQMTGKGKEIRAASSPDDIPRRGRGGGILNKMFRRA
ncbi:hypothetical protein CEP52_006687 [Fusarium oligoseptatum]|uniref:Uncharacterized protein n=1 Tax=Fusarium oligoseptatum TaxID=2604345 RepID=A0A428TRL0_9HYPO|nr:hypothetical protein CEP52_006687 [Fusarium oligoseptatum]